MKIRHLYSFFADVYASFRSRTVFFVRNDSFCNIRQSRILCCACNKYQSSKHHSLATTTKQPYAVSIYQNIKKPYVVSHETKHKKHRTHAALSKQFKFIIPGFATRHRFNKPAVVIADSLFAVFRHLCFNGCLCDMRHPFKVGFRNKNTANRRRSPINKHLSKNIVFTIRQRKIIRPQTTRINIIRILHPFHVQNHNKRSYANS